MTVREMLATLQQLPKDAEVLASSAPRYGTGSSSPRHASAFDSRNRSRSGSSRWQPRRSRPSSRRCRPRYRALIVLAAGTGLRQGEALAMEVGAIDFLRRTLRVDQQLVLLPGGEPYVAAPKTPASYRTVPLPQVVSTP